MKKPILMLLPNPKRLSLETQFTTIHLALAVFRMRGLEDRFTFLTHPEKLVPIRIMVSR